MRKARTLNDIKAHPWVYDAFNDGDGWWVYMHAGFIQPDMECGSIHEDTIRECCDMLNNARRATPEEIEPQGYTLEEAQANWEQYDV